MSSSPRILSIYGTRPEAIKMAPLIKEIEVDSALESVVLVTAQHREMLDQVNELFGIQPDRDLNIMAKGQSLNQITARVIQGVDKELVDLAPDAIVVQGDTTTVMASAIAAFNRSIPVIHLEAGLRSGNLFNPFPEEANRKLTGQIASLHLAPTGRSRANLENDGIDSNAIAVTGNTVIDALQMAVDLQVEPEDQATRDYLAATGPKVLVTTHRRENLGRSMENIGDALNELATNRPDVTYLLPAHKNPLVREAVLPRVMRCPNVLVTEPVSYGAFTTVMNASDIVLTDSGGIQEEAPSLAKPVLVMRENTERPEAVDAGTVELVGTEREQIVNAVTKLLDDEAHYASMAQAVNPYGDGKAAQRSVAAIKHMFNIGSRLPDFA